MAHRVLIPTPLRSYTGQKDAVEAEGGTVGEVLASLTASYGDLRRHLYADDGKLRHFVNVYVNDDDIRYLERDATKLKPGDVISIVPSVAGGAPGPGTATPPDHKRESNPELSNAEIQRYSRHLILPEVGIDGQRRLKAGRVLCIGAGGLGSPATLYLAAAGVGTIGVVDFDAVDESNLQRQILHGTPDVGRSKLQSARDRLTALNPEVRVETFETRLTSANALELFRDYDVILDGTDNFATRYLVNDACVLLRKPNAYGSIFRFEGQASVFATVGGPCYRCLYPEPPPPGLVPSCAEGGVLGVLPGVIGTIQATEAIKLILGGGSTLVGRLLLYDAWTMRFRELKLRRDASCPVCGDHPTIKQLIDYEEFCGVRPAVAAAGPGVPETTVEELKARIDAQAPVYILDVREPHEFQISRIPGSTLIPLGQLGNRVNELPASSEGREIIVHCKSGVRSAKAVALLKERGIEARNLKGGILAWIDKIDPTLAKY
jgi:molybdopterin/thiamine biosynthesis adenylyltransferase/rhodanese-related sulfurtransferase/molybdopterin converting factor small subunit